MSFALWKEKPPFPEEQLTKIKDFEERIYARVAGVWKRIGEVAEGEVPDLWCVSSGGIPAPEKVDALENPPLIAVKAPEDKLAEFLVTNPDVDALISAKKATLITNVI